MTAKKLTNFRLPLEMIELMRKNSLRQGISMNELTENAIALYLVSKILHRKGALHLETNALHEKPDNALHLFADFWHQVVVFSPVLDTGVRTRAEKPIDTRAPAKKTLGVIE